MLDLDAIERRYRCPDLQCGMPECGCDEDVIDIIAELRKLREESRWIPIEERFPKDAGMYLVADEDGLVEQRSFNGHFLRLRNMRMVAWRPLPQPPEVEP